MKKAKGKKTKAVPSGSSDDVPTPARIPISPQANLNRYEQLPPVNGELFKPKTNVMGDLVRAKKSVDTQKQKLELLEDPSVVDFIDVAEDQAVTKSFSRKTARRPRDGPIMRNQSVRLQPVELNYDDLFGNFGIKDYYPLHQITNVLKVQQMQYINSLSLDGIDQLTDLFFRCLLDEVESGRFKPDIGIESISLQGCTNITDKGIDWMSRALGKSLQKVILTGCNITSQAIAYLYLNIKAELPRLEVAGTGVDFVPLQRHWFKMTKFLNYGCPLVLPVSGDIMELVKEGSQLPLKTYKAVIIRNESIKMSVTEFLFAQTVNPNNVQPLSICPQWKHTNGSTYNFIECDMDISDLFISERALFILPYETDAEVESTQTSLVDNIIHVLSKVPHAVVILLRIGKGNLKSTPADVPAKVKEMLKKAKEELEKETKEIMGNLSSQTSFEGQQLACNAFTMIEAIDNVHLIPVDMDIATKQVPLQFEKALDQFEEKINSFYPQYEKVIKEVFALMDKVDRKAGVEDATALAKELTKTKLLHGNEDTYLRALNVMHITGKILFYPEAGSEGKLVTDLQWFGKVLNVILTKAQETAKGRLMCVTPQTSLWSPDSLKNALKTMIQGKDTLDGMIGLLSKQGVVYSPHYLFVCHHLPKHTHMPFEHYWTNPTSSKDATQVYTYTFCHTVPSSVMFKVFEYCVRLRHPAVVWRRGILIQEGAVDCLIRLAQDRKSIEVCSRTFPIKDQTNTKQIEVILDCLWSTVKQYKLIVDYCLFKVFKLFAKISSTSFNIQELSGTYSIKGTFPDVVPYHHVIQDKGNQQKQACCEWCGMLGDNIKSLWMMHQELRPTFHNQHVSVKDQRLNIFRMTGDAEIISSACMTPYEFSHFDVLLMESCDGLGVGVRSWHRNPGYEVFLENWKVLMTTNHTQQKVQMALPTIKRTKKGDTIRIALREGNKPDKYVFTILSNGILLFDMEVPRDDYIPLIRHSGTSSANMAECIVDMSLAPKWQTAYPSKDVKIKDIDLKQHEGEFINRKVEILGKMENGTTGVFPATLTGLRWEGQSTMVEVTVDMKVHAKPVTVGLDNVLPVGYTETRDKSVVDEYKNIIAWAGASEDFSWREYLSTENTDPLPACFLTYENEENLVIPSLKGFTTYHGTQCRKLRNRPIVQETFIRHAVEKIMRRYGLMAGAIPNLPIFSLLPDLRQDDIMYPTRSIVQLAQLKFHFLCSVKVFETFVRHALEKLLKRYGGMSANIPMYSLMPDLMQEDLLYPTRQCLQLDKFKLHFLCPFKDCMHFINAKGVPIVESNGEVISAMMTLATLCNVILLDQKVFIPNDVSNLVNMKEEIPPNLLDAGLRRILYMAICTFSMLHKDVLLPILSGSDMMKSSLFAKMIVSVVKVTEEMITKKGEASGISSQMVFKKDSESDKMMWNCPGHAMSSMKNMGIDSFPMDIFKQYLNLVTMLNLSSNAFTSFPGDVFEKFTALTDVDLSNNKLLTLPENIGKAQALVSLNVSHNQLGNLPASMKDLKTLTYLNLASNPLMKLEKGAYNLVNLCFLDLSNTGLISLAEDISKLKSLKVLLLAGLGLKNLPENFRCLTKLTKLDLSGIKWFEVQNRNSILTRTSFDEFLETNVLLKAISKAERDTMFNSFDKGHKGNLDFDDIHVMNTNLFQKFNRFDNKGGKGKDSKAKGLGGFPEQLLQLTELEHLLMSYQGLSSVPDQVNAFKKLKFLDVSHSPKLEYVSGELGVAPLEGLFLKGCPSLKTPPREIVSKGFKVTYAYLKRLHMGSVTCKRTKLMMVGLGGAGKTSLVKSLTANQLQKSSQGAEMITDGIDITNWKVKDEGSNEELTFSVWDFAGQTVYYNTHQFFLSNRAVYLLLWNVRLGYEHAGLDFWCSSIACHAPKAPILVVGSHVDKVEKPELPEEAMRKRYPQIKGFHYISSATGIGLKELSDNLTRITKQEKYMGEMIPEAWLNLEKMILNERGKANLLPWDTVANFATQTGVFDTEETSNAVQFLHELGSLQHFTNDRLKSRVVINPQWIVDVMACVVSVHSSPITQGLFHKKDMSVIWKDYPEDLHSWLLDLTEEFDLTFPLSDQEANLVPCLLPETEPKYVWPDVTETVGQRETKMFYKFEYLPVGLFNRAQVRLYQFSDKSVIWRKGSLLRKNNHLALVAQAGDSELEVKVQGPRPENILFLIHEVFESLIAESFHGVQYDYFVPCTDCITEGSLDPCMFAASKIRRAMEFKAPFLQCDKYFHMLTMTELLAMKPPESGSDYDAHLEKTAHDLRNLKQTMSKQIVIYYCTANSPRTGQTWPSDVAHPRQIRGDLAKAGFTLWIPENPAQMMLDQFTITLKHAQLIIVCMSNEFEKDKKCVDLLHYIKEILKKKILVICLGENYAWQKTNLGLYTASEVYVNMTKGKPYKEKVDELKEAILRKLGNVKKAESFDCFLSYCWSNSHHAVKLGQQRVPEALGWGDPREVKDYLENNGIHSWMDIERTGVGGLMEDIAEGLRHAKVMVACISEDYVKSRNCLMEFQFAKVTLRIPIVIAVFGSGTKWETSELGMLSLGHDRVDFQHENPTGHQRLLEMVREKLPKDAGNGDEAIDDVENQQISYHELLELGQRKFLRQVSLYADSMESGFFPRLVIVDILPIEQPTVEDASKKPDSSGNDKGEKGQEDKKEQEQMFKDPSTGAYRLCFKLLCENEDGWHVAEPSIPCEMMSKPEQDKFLLSIAPYLIRILAVLKHSTLNLNMILTPEGEALVQSLQEKISTETSDFREQYMIVRKAVMAQNSDEVMDNMKRCGLPSRKVIWLCKEHQKANRVVVLDKDDAGIGVMETDDDAILVEQLQQHHEVLIKDIDAARLDAIAQKRGKLVESVLAANIGMNNSATSQICTIS